MTTQTKKETHTRTHSQRTLQLVKERCAHFIFGKNANGMPCKWFFFQKCYCAKPHTPHGRTTQYPNLMCVCVRMYSLMQNRWKWLGIVYKVNGPVLTALFFSAYLCSVLHFSHLCVVLFWPPFHMMVIEKKKYKFIAEKKCVHVFCARLFVCFGMRVWKIVYKCESESECERKRQR